MNRSALCIKMLNLLKARGRLKGSELAVLLDTNVRNIREFRKELEIAGYHIDSIPGKNGGYELLEEDLLPTIAFDEVEVAALVSGLEVLKRVPNFIVFQEYQSAMDKVLAVTRKKAKDEVAYIGVSNNEMDENLKKWLTIAKRAQRENCYVVLTYTPLHADEAQTLQVQPYEIIYYNNSYYLIGFTKERNGFRTYKFSNTRIQKLEATNQKFAKDDSFKLQDYLGKHGLMKDEAFHVVLEVKGSLAVVMNEQTIGIELKKVYKDKVLYLETLMEGKQAIVRYLLSLGAAVEIKSPKSIVEAYESEVFAMVNKLKG